METTGRLFNIQKFSIHDGPGIRTTVFLKGCPLSCKWCHNPESISPEPSLAFYDFRCAGCGECVRVCPTGAMKPGAFDRSLCIACGKCAKVCAYGARELFGYEDTVENVMRTVMEDRIFYETSGGGMTISGGEPFYQPEFTLALLQAAKEQGLDTAVETNLFTSRAWPEAAAPLTDLFYVDVKLIDPDKHRRWCGAPNRVILENIAFLSGLGARIIFRTPLIPGVNDTEIAGIGEFVLSLPERHPVEILKYHRIGAGKYASLGMDYSLDAEPADPEPVRETLRKMGVEVIGE